MEDKGRLEEEMTNLRTKVEGVMEGRRRNYEVFMEKMDDRTRKCVDDIIKVIHSGMKVWKYHAVFRKFAFCNIRSSEIHLHAYFSLEIHSWNSCTV